MDPTCDLTKRWLRWTHRIVQHTGYNSDDTGNTLEYLSNPSNPSLYSNWKSRRRYLPANGVTTSPALLIHKWVWQTRPLPPALSREPESVTWNGVTRLLSMVIIYLLWIWLLVASWCNGLSLSIFPSCLERVSLSWILEDSILVVTLSLWFSVMILSLWCECANWKGFSPGIPFSIRQPEYANWEFIQMPLNQEDPVGIPAKSGSEIGIT